MKIFKIHDMTPRCTTPIWRPSRKSAPGVRFGFFQCVVKRYQKSVRLHPGRNTVHFIWAGGLARAGRHRMAALSSWGWYQLTGKPSGKVRHTLSVHGALQHGWARRKIFRPGRA